MSIERTDAQTLEDYLGCEEDEGYGCSCEQHRGRAEAYAALARLEARLAAAEDALRLAKEIVGEQAEDDALWFISVSITEAYFQQELRRLHAAVEAAVVPEGTAKEASA